MAESKVREILRNAGVADDMIETLVATGLDDATAKDLAPILAIQYPAGGSSLYGQAEQDLGFTDASQDVRAAEGLMARAKLGLGGWKTTDVGRGFITSESGALRFNNGVIANPETGEVFFPPNDETVQGSWAWLSKIQDTWDDSKVKEWRERLADYGYEIGEEGPPDQVFLQALQQYHQTRYLNRGKPLPLDASLGKDAASKRVFDPAEVRNFWRMQFRRILGDDPTDTELEEFSKATTDFAKRFVRKGYTPEQAAVAAEERSVELLENDPKVQFLADSEEDRTDLRDGLLGTVQAINSVA